MKERLKKFGRWIICKVRSFDWKTFLREYVLMVIGGLIGLGIGSFKTSQAILKGIHKGDIIGFHTPKDGDFEIHIKPMKKD